MRLTKHRQRTGHVEPFAKPIIVTNCNRWVSLRVGDAQPCSDTHHPTHAVRAIIPDSWLWIPGSPTQMRGRPGMTMVCAIASLPRLQIPKPLPALAVEAHELHLVYGDVVGRRRVDLDAGQQHRQFEILDG